MTILPIIIAPDPVLKTRATEVETITDDTRVFINNLFDTMYDAHGIGLAANQVGDLRRVVVMDVPNDDDEQMSPIAMINPVIIEESDATSTTEEGCLSIPDQNAVVRRPEAVTVEFLDASAKKCTLKVNGLLATCIQHEIDHLDGKLFIDYLSSLKRNMILKKMQKLKKEIS